MGISNNTNPRLGNMESYLRECGATVREYGAAARECCATFREYRATFREYRAASLTPSHAPKSCLRMPA